ncbi:TPA: hypothetical protein RRG99_004533 [Klebsiella pneumoniae]|nr:hypothetical protein [Klebsiella pneumoniae]
MKSPPRGGPIENGASRDVKSPSPASALGARRVPAADFGIIGGSRRENRL